MTNNMTVKEDTTKPNVVFLEVNSNDHGQTLMASQLKDGSFVAVQQGSSKNVVFAGVSEGMSVINRMIGVDYAEMQELLTRAVNNRTRQRNFFQLQNSLLEGTITEEEFYKIIEENEDDYVVEELEQPTKERLYHALYLSQGIKDVDSSEDISNLFSFDSAKTEKELEKLDANGGL